MSKHTLKSGENVVNKKDFLASKQAIALNFVESSKILFSDKFELSDDGCKYFIGYLHNDDVFKPLCIILPQMSGYIKYFGNSRKNMPFLIEDESVYLKYNKIWNKIKKLLNIKFHSQPTNDNKYIKSKVKTFHEAIKTHFSDNKVPKEKSHYICIAAICIESVLKKEGKNHPQVYLEQCKYKIKRRKPVDFIDAEVDLSSSDTDE